MIPNYESIQRAYDNHGDRKPTDVLWIYVCIGFVVILFGYVGYCYTIADFSRLSKRLDSCGNDCGSLDKANENVIEYNQTASSVSSIDPTKTAVNSTEAAVDPTEAAVYPTETALDPSETTVGQTEANSVSSEARVNPNQSPNGGFINDVLQLCLQILLICFIAISFSYIVLVLFRYAILYVIWIIYGSMIALLFIAALIVQYAVNAPHMLIFSGGLAILGICLTVYVILLRERIRLVAQLFKEALKALSDIPLLLLQPLLTFITLILSFVLFVVFMTIIFAAGPLPSNNPHEKSKTNGLQQAAFVINIIAFAWFMNFIITCQHFVVAGTISQWYSMLTKSKLEAPISTSFSNLVRFHLGSVCFGSVSMIGFKIFKLLLEKTVRQSTGCIGSWLMGMLEDFLQYFMRNAYIVIAKDGTPLVKSGKKAFHLLKSHLTDIIALNTIGDFVMVVARIFVVVITSFVGVLVLTPNNSFGTQFPLTIGIVLAFIIIHCVMTVLEMTIDTIFICFCEDCEVNNGIDRPYLMSPGLMKVMQDLKKVAGGEFVFGEGNVEAGAYPMVQQGIGFNSKDLNYNFDR